IEEMKLIEEIEQIMSAGAAGMAIGRNIWQSDDPVGLSKKIARKIFNF
ncbi:MAG: Fructose-bisphosphate aldolase class 1, partial [Candidatus Amesbacteria bacterium GW2011_GWA2_47_70]